MTSPSARLAGFARPPRLAALCDRLVPWAGGLFVLCLAAALVYALAVAPPDYRQGEAVRILALSLPAAWMAVAVYVLAALLGAAGLTRDRPLVFAAARAALAPGAAFALIAVAAHVLWGRPAWNAWWEWDGRSAFLVLLLLLYLGAGLPARDGDSRRLALLLAAGALALPFLRIATDWWVALHRPEGVLPLGDEPGDAADPLALILMLGAFKAWFLTVWLMRFSAALPRGPEGSP